MIIWLASYPRSGSTYLRIALNRLHGARSSVVYDFDGVARRLGADLVGYEDRPADYPALRQSGEVHFIKTHRQCGPQIAPEDRAICLVRDGRDALVSWAMQLSENDLDDFPSRLRDLIETRSSSGTGGWCQNVLGWLSAGHTGRVMLRYEDFIAAPHRTLEGTLRALGVELPERGGALPSFRELSARDPQFFRRGQAGSHCDEMPPDLHDLFWSCPDNVAAMSLAGYRR
ncbi:MAG: hypothetical protein JWM33_1281 [Caulobacteraceae bacterium]|nr:hypothetical protein [Caulobacteraceae bacterium]